ncbi:MAG TPA: DUF1080 domain-containing protein [Puia sp.]|nr:DUF1080 domain-containing protein [Puia sp.]
MTTVNDSRGTALRLCGVLLILSSWAPAPAGEYRDLFNGRDLSGWENVYGPTDSWSVTDGSLLCKGTPHGYLRSDVPFENFTLELETRGDSAAIMLYADALPEVGQPLPRGLRCLLTDAASDRRISTDTWRHCRVESRSGHVRVYVEGKLVSNIEQPTRRKGYLALVSAGSTTAFRHIRIKELPSTNPSPDQIATTDQGFISLYNGVDLNSWQMKPGHRNHWTALDWVINYDGRSQEKDKCLWSKKSYADFILIADVRLMRKPEPELSPVILPNGDNALNPDGSKKQVYIPYNGDTGIYLRGNSKSQVNIGNRYIGSGEIYGYRTDTTLPAEVRAAVTPKVKADKPPGEWNRFIIIMKGQRVSVTLNGIQVIQDALLPGIPATGPLALQDDHADNNQFQFANLFIKEL